MSGFWDRPNKNEARRCAQPTSCKRHTLWLPGVDTMDVRLACENKRLHRQGKHIVVERDPEVAKKIRRKLSQLTRKHGVKFEFHEGPLHALELDRPLEYAHFDFCGGLTPEVADWLFDQLQVVDGGEVHFTFAYALRGSKFLHQCDELFLSNQQFMQLEGYQFNTLERNHRRIAFYCALIQCMLNRFNFTSLTPVKYKDTVQPMVLYSCIDMENRKQSLKELDFRPFLEDKPSSAKSVESVKRSSAAQKAWATRRKKKEVTS